MTLAVEIMRGSMPIEVTVVAMQARNNEPLIGNLQRHQLKNNSGHPCVGPQRKAWFHRPAISKIATKNLKQADAEPPNLRTGAHLFMQST